MSTQSDLLIPSGDDTISDLETLTADLALSDDKTTGQDVQQHVEIKPDKCVDDMLVESFEFLQNKRKDHLDLNTLTSWTVFSERNTSFNEHTKFADQKVVKELFFAYTEYEKIPEKELKKKLVNPLELVKRAFLLNRSAIKFANIDSAMDYMFSNPMDKQKNSLVQPNELMYFVDIGGPPGGFVDYLLWKRDWQTKGFGIPIKETDYFSHRLTVGGQRLSIFKGAKRDGDVTNEDNITSIVRYVKQHISLGVHVVIADCAYHVEEQKYAKETIFKQMHLGEIILALSLLRQNGHFIIKIFDMLCPFTVGLIYLMHKCFAEICLIKPKTSRPTSAERYLICKWKNADTEIIRSYLFQLNTKMNEKKNIDAIHLVPEEVLLNDKDFYNFIYKSNNMIAESQTHAMLQILKLTDNQVNYSHDSSLIERCLQKWNVLPKIENVFDCTFGQWAEIVYAPENSLSPLLPLADSFNLPGDKLANEWHFIPIENIDNDKRTFFATKNSNEVMMLDPITSEWLIVPEIGLEFPTNTFLYGEIVYHHISNADNTSPHGFHIIDGLVLNGQDIRHHPYSMRIELCNKFAQAINNPSRFIKNRTGGRRRRSASIYCKDSCPLKDLIPYIEQFRKSRKATQNGLQVLGLNVRTLIGPKRFYQVNGLLFLRNFSAISDETNFDETFKCRQIWNWPRSEILNTVDIKKIPADSCLYLSHFYEYMNKSIEQEFLNSNWRDKNRRVIPSRYSNNRGRGGGAGRGFKR